MRGPWVLLGVLACRTEPQDRPTDVADTGDAETGTDTGAGTDTDAVAHTAHTGEEAHTGADVPTGDTGLGSLPVDEDGDGHAGLDSGGDDCDDEDDAVFPGAPERCGDGRLTDCDRSDEDGLVTVDGDASFADLQLALDAASPGSRIDVCAGTWLGPFVSAVPVELHGVEGPTRTTLDGQDLGTTLTVPGGSEISGLAVRNGRAARGGGIRTTSAGALVVADGSVLENEADIGGGLALADGTDATIVRTRIALNVASVEGGGVAASGGTLDLADASLEGNEAPQGAAVSFADGTLTGGVARANRVLASAPYLSDDPRGALALSGVVEVVGTEITRSDGSGVALVGATATLTDVQVVTNSALAYGGGVHARDSELVLAGTTRIEDNGAPSAGGGLYLLDSEVSGGLVLGNQADDGGGLVLRGSAATDVVVEGNSAQWNGGGLEALGSARVTGGRLAGNDAYAGCGANAAVGAALILEGVEVVENVGANALFLARDATITVSGGAVLRNRGGAHLEDDASRLVSDGADWGSGADDNVSYDVWLEGPFTTLRGYGVASFTCDALACDPLP